MNAQEISSTRLQGAGKGKRCVFARRIGFEQPAHPGRVHSRFQGDPAPRHAPNTSFIAFGVVPTFCFSTSSPAYRSRYASHFRSFWLLHAIMRSDSDLAASPRLPHILVVARRGTTLFRLSAVEASPKASKEGKLHLARFFRPAGSVWSGPYFSRSEVFPRSGKTQNWVRVPSVMCAAD
jgi:hypothetical protein